MDRLGGRLGGEVCGCERQAKIECSRQTQSLDMTNKRNYSFAPIPGNDFEPGLGGRGELDGARSSPLSDASQPMTNMSPMQNIRPLACRVMAKITMARPTKTSPTFFFCKGPSTTACSFFHRRSLLSHFHGGSNCIFVCCLWRQPTQKEDCCNRLHITFRRVFRILQFSL